MKKIVIITLSISFMLVACLRNSKENRAQIKYSETGGRPFYYQISNGELGNVSIGDRIDTTLEKLTVWFQIKTDSTPSCEGCDEYTPLFVVYQKDSIYPLFFIEPGWEENNKNQVYRITTLNGQIATDKFIKVGMTVEDLKKAYEILEVDCSGETGVHILVKDFNGSFGIELPNDEKWWSYTIETIPDTLKIIEIIIT